MLNLTWLIIALGTPLVVFLLATGIGFFLVSVFGVFRIIRRLGSRDGETKPASPNSSEDGLVLVLIASKNEGTLAWDSAQSVLEQEYAGKIECWLLTPDSEDSGHQAARKSLMSFKFPADRSLKLLTSGVGPKHLQLNFALEEIFRRKIHPRVVGFLDADHEADRNWVNQGLLRLDELPERAAVQARRRPKLDSGSSWSALWDAAENHGGNELYQRFLFSAGKTLCFTGTTALFKASVFTDRRFSSFSSMITEDTELSFRLIAHGKTIGYEPKAGSREEVAPDVASFIRRRRRWAAGHTASAWLHFKGLLQSREPVRMLLHGTYFLVFPATLLLLTLIGLHLLFQLPPAHVLLIFVLSLFLGYGFTALFDSGQSGGTERFVATAIALPIVTLTWPLFLSSIDHPIAPFLSAFPFRKTRWILTVLLVSVSLIATAVAQLEFALFSVGQVFRLVLSAPLALGLNLYGGSLGFVDFLRGRTDWASWVPTTRRSEVAPAWLSRARASLALLIIVIGTLTGYCWRYLTLSECGSVPGWLAPVLGIPPWMLSTEPLRLEGELATWEVRALFADGRERPGRVEIAINGRSLADAEVNKDDKTAVWSAKVSAQPGWEAMPLEARYFAQGASVPTCVATRPLSTRFVDLSGNTLRVNGEPFLIKGMIPTFSSPRIGIPLAQGLDQIAEIGVNTIRLYHPASSDWLSGLKKEGLMLIEQPSHSVWDETDLTRSSQAKSLAEAYLSLLRARQSEPQALLLLAGNELELGSGTVEKRRLLKNEWLPELRSLREKWGHHHPALGYSSYLALENYPLDIFGLNALDSGNTYWNGALGRLVKNGTPFFLSEWGGFVAAKERPPTLLRLARMSEEWNRLLELGALGAVFYESHDDWAQPVFDWVNDPFTPDHPDDTRGVWNEKNQPKPERDLLMRLYSDVDVTLSPAAHGDWSGPLLAVIRNRRSYALRSTSWKAGGTLWNLGTLLPHEEKRRVFSTRESSQLKPDPDGQIGWRLETLTHSGLKARSTGRSPLPRGGIAVWSEDWVLAEAPTPNRQAGFLYQSRKIEFGAPFPVRVAGRIFQAGRHSVEIPSTFSEIRPSAKTQSPDGSIREKWVIPAKREAQASVIVRSLKTTHIALNGRSFACHPYRDCLIPLSTVPELDPSGKNDGTIEAIWRVDHDDYWPARDDPKGIGVSIPREPPLLFNPLKIEIERVERVK